MYDKLEEEKELEQRKKEMKAKPIAICVPAKYLKEIDDWVAEKKRSGHITLNRSTALWKTLLEKIRNDEKHTKRTGEKKDERVHR